MISRDEIGKVVEIFYKPPFKTFYVNSEDGVTLIPSKGVFISLGMTTSLKTLIDLKEIIGKSDKYEAKLVELSSIFRDEQFINTVVSENITKQYTIALEDLPDSVFTSREAAMKRLEEMKVFMSPKSSLETLSEYGPKVNKLQKLIDRLDESNGWENHSIQEEGNDYRIYHLNINYIKREGIEYRIGILVNEKTNTN